MSKNPKKKKRRRLSSSSSEEERASDSQHDDLRRKGCKRRKDKAGHKSRTEEQKKSDQDGSRSSRKMKKPIYKLSTTKQEPKAPQKGEQLKNCGSDKLRLEDSSSIARNASEIQIQTVEREQSKPVKTSLAVLLDHITQKALIEKSDKRSQGSYSKLENQQMSFKSEHRDHRQGVERNTASVREPSTTTCDRSKIKTQDPTPSHYKDFSNWSSKEQVKNTSKSQLNERSSCLDTEKLPTTVPLKSVISRKPSTSGTDPKKWRSFTSTPENDKSTSSKKERPPSTPQKMDPLKFVPFKFRLPRNVHAGAVHSSGGNNNSVSLNQILKPKSNKTVSSAVVREAEPTTGKPHRGFAGPSNSPCKEQNKRLSLPDQLPPEHPAGDANRERFFDQGQVVEELHLARSEKRLELDVMQSYGELTAMDIDAPEEGAAESHKPKQKTLILVLDTNILLSHLEYVKKIRTCGLEVLGFPVVLIPWVVLQELDSLKNRKGVSGSVAHLAAPAISFIYTSLKKRDPHLWGQSMQQATQMRNGLNAENNDDRVLQCCLQYQQMYPECALILCTNDKNLSSKALLSGVRAFSKADLEAGVRKSRHGHNFLQSIQSPVLSHFDHVSSSALSASYTPVQPPIQNSSGVSASTPEKGLSPNSPGLKRDDCQEREWDLSGHLFELEESLRDVLSDVLETEMKVAYGDLWLEIVYIKPPWSLEDILQCFKKHWIAVFGHIVTRKMSETVEKLINFFSSGETVSTLSLLLKIKELLKAFGKSSKQVPAAITVIENILNKLQSPQQFLSDDVVMNDDDADKQPSSDSVTPQKVWAVFENIWSQVYQTSLEVFKALGFDPNTMQAAMPMGHSPPPQDALACLHRLSSMVSQLLQAFSRVLSSTPSLEELRSLFSVLYSNKLVCEEARLTAKDLLGCFSQPDYREKLRVGGNQLLELKKALDGCVQTTGQNLAFTTQCQ